MVIEFIAPGDICRYPDGLLVDVRDQDYGDRGYLQQSVNITISDLAVPSKLAQMAQYHTIICYCMYSQQRGPAFAKRVAGMFPDKRVLVVSGGFDAISRALAEQVVPE